MRTLPWAGENFDQHWGFVDWRGKVVLDVGADYGSSADFFLDRGAVRVVAVECDGRFVRALGRLAMVLPSLECVNKRMRCGEDFGGLIKRAVPDVVKVDCEGAEAYLLEVEDEVFCRVAEYVVEVHPKHVSEASGNHHGYRDQGALLAAFLEQFARLKYRVVRRFQMGSCWIVHAQRSGAGEGADSG